MRLKPLHRIGILAMSLLAPRRLAAIMLRAPVRHSGGEVGLAAEAERVEFASGDGALCRGWWLTPLTGVADRAVVVTHGWTSQYLRMRPLVEPLLAGGNQVLLYDARGHGESDPTPYCSLRQFTDDLHHAVRFARARVERVAVLGHSLGGSASIVSTAEGSGAERVATLAAFADPRQASADILNREGMPGDLVMQRIGPHVESFIGCRFETITPELRIREVKVPHLLIHGTEDEVVPVAHFHRLVAAGGSQVEPLLIDGADHDSIKTHPEVLARVEAFLRAW
ncbi:MAG: alpha/beta hydrolase [Bacillota bacterium]